MKNRDGLIHILWVSLLASICFNVGFWSENVRIKRGLHPYFKTLQYPMSYMEYPKRPKPLTKDELKALDLKLRQEALIFHEGDRCVDRYPQSDGFCQTALVLKVDGGLATIQYEKTGITDITSMMWLLKIGDDYIPPYKLPPLFSFKLDTLSFPIPANFVIDSAYLKIIVADINEGKTSGVTYHYINSRYRAEIELP